MIEYTIYICSLELRLSTYIINFSLYIYVNLLRSEIAHT